MKVKELILKLQAIEDREQEIYRFDSEWGPEEIKDVDVYRYYKGRDDQDRPIHEDLLCITS